MRLSTEWISDGPNASAEERATLCNLQIFVNDENACLHFDPDSRATFEHITVPAVHFAEGLATDWWSIFGGRDREHQVLLYRTGFALPDLSFKCDGSTLEVTGWPTGSEVLSRHHAESTLAEFIERVIDQLSRSEVSRSEVAVRWSRVSDSRNEIASSFMVSPQVVACQIESQDRIREACAWDP